MIARVGVHIVRSGIVTVLSTPSCAGGEARGRWRRDPSIYSSTLLNTEDIEKKLERTPRFCSAPPSNLAEVGNDLVASPFGRGRTDETGAGEGGCGQPLPSSPSLLPEAEGCERQR